MAAAVIVEIPLPVSDQDVVRVGERNPGWRVERIAGDLIMTPPSGMKSDGRSAHVVAMMIAWARSAGGFVSASQGGIKPPNGDLVAPDAAWVAPDRWNTLSPEQQEGFLPFAPDVAIEVLSHSDSVRHLRAKCARWHAAGVGYVVLIDPYRKQIETWGAPPAAHFPDFDAILEL